MQEKVKKIFFFFIFCEACQKLLKLNYLKKVFYFALNFLPWEFVLIKIWISKKLRPSSLQLLQLIWDHPFKTTANFHDFWPLRPYHRHSSKMLMKGIFDPYVLWPFDHRHMGTPLPPKTCWRLKWMVPIIKVVLVFLISNIFTM